MFRFILISFLTLTGLLADGLKYDADGKLVRPENYRDWVFLGSGLGMTYGPAAVMSERPMFDTVFVSPESWKSFKASGKWPDQTVFILEIRASSSHGSINKAGYFPTDVVGIEAAVKDAKRFEGGWGYFDFPNTAPGEHVDSAKVLPKTASCYACHQTNGAVENTFVQFYPQALEIAERFNTLNAKYERPAPTPAKFYRSVVAEGWEKSARTLEAAYAKDPKSPLVQEESLNRLGYQFLASQRTGDAVAILEWTARTYPKSAVAQYSLAEALTSAGQVKRAAEAGAKACALLATDKSLDEARRKALTQECTARKGR